MESRSWQIMACSSLKVPLQSGPRWRIFLTMVKAWVRNSVLIGRTGLRLRIARIPHIWSAPSQGGGRIETRPLARQSLDGNSIAATHAAPVENIVQDTSENMPSGGHHCANGIRTW